jgi:hypothetical protein
MRIITVVLLVVVVGSVIAATTGTAHAQSVESCNIYPSNGSCTGGIGRHETVSGGLGGGTAHGGWCWTCYKGGEQVTPDHCHQCGFEDGEDYAVLMKAIESRDVNEVVRLGGRFAQRLHVNRDRSALQVLSCNGGQVIAHMPLRRSSVSHVYAAVVRAQKAYASLALATDR